MSPLGGDSRWFQVPEGNVIVTGWLIFLRGGSLGEVLGLWRFEGGVVPISEVFGDPLLGAFPVKFQFPFSPVCWFRARLGVSNNAVL